MDDWRLWFLFVVFVLGPAWLAGVIEMRRRRRKRAEAALHASAPDVERIIDKIMRLPKKERDEMARIVDFLLEGRGHS